MIKRLCLSNNIYDWSASGGIFLPNRSGTADSAVKNRTWIKRALTVRTNREPWKRRRIYRPVGEAISRFKAVEQIIAVTHSEDFSEKAEHVVRFEKQAGISRISVER